MATTVLQPEYNPEAQAPGRAAFALAVFGGVLGGSALAYGVGAVINAIVPIPDSVAMVLLLLGPVFAVFACLAALRRWRRSRLPRLTLTDEGIELRRGRTRAPLLAAKSTEIKAARAQHHSTTYVQGDFGRKYSPVYRGPTLVLELSPAESLTLGVGDPGLSWTDVDHEDTVPGLLLSVEEFEELCRHLGLQTKLARQAPSE